MLQTALEENHTPLTVEEVKDMLLRTEKGAVKSTIGNCLIVFQNDPYLAGSLAYNLLAMKTYIVKPLWYDRPEGEAMDDTDMAYIRLYMENNYGLTCKEKIEVAAVLAAHENTFHPVQDYLNQLSWDGTERIRYCLHHFLGSDVDDFNYEVFKLFLMGAISRAFHPGCKFDVMLCLVGGQGAGKSTFFRFLAVKDEWFSDDLRKLDDKDVYEKLQGYWIIEMSEMIATANAKSIEEIKSFLSRQKENYRIRYDKFASDKLRKCVFGGTSNTMDFLPLDRSGNRRFLPVMVKTEEAEVHIMADQTESRAYIEQVWAEAMEIYRSGDFELKLPDKMQKMLKDRQQEFMPEDTKAGMIQAFLDSYKGNTVCSKLLCKEALNHTYDDPQNWELREICDIMNQSISGWNYFSNPRNFADYGRQRGWERADLATKSCNKKEISQQNLFDEFTEIANTEEIPFK